MIQDKGKQFISVLVYIHNDEKVIDESFGSMFEFFTEYFKSFEIILINDKSRDKSISLIHEFIKDLPGRHDGIITVVNMSKYHGVELAMNAGLDLSIGDFIFEIDSIKNIEKSILLDVYNKAMEGYDIVSAVPQKIHGLTSKIFYTVYNFFGGRGRERSPLTQEYFRIVSRRALNRIKMGARYVPYRKVLYSRSGLPQTAIRYKNDNFIQARGKNGHLNLALDSLVIFTDSAQKISLSICLLFALFALGVGGYSAFIYFGTRRPVEGWTPMMAFLSVGFFGIFLMLTGVFKYLSLIINMLFVKKWYTVESIEKL